MSSHQRTNRIPKDIHVEPEKFAAELIGRLEGVLREREAQEKLEERLKRVRLVSASESSCHCRIFSYSSFFVSLVSNTDVSATSVHERDSRMCSKDFLSYQGDSAHFFRLSVQCQVNHLLRLSYLLVCLSVMTLFEVSRGVKKCLRTPQMGIFFPTQSQVLSLKADYLCSLASCKRNFRHRPVTLSY